MHPVERLMQMVTAECENLRLDYFVTGSMASMSWGTARYTEDVDIVVGLPSWKAAKLCEAFRPPEFYASADAALEAARHGTQFNILWINEGVRADLIAFKGTPFEESALSRAKPYSLPGGTVVRMSSPEDVILNKLLFFRRRPLGQAPARHLRDLPYPWSDDRSRVPGNVGRQARRRGGVGVCSGGHAR